MHGLLDGGERQGLVAARRHDAVEGVGQALACRAHGLVLRLALGRAGRVIREALLNVRGAAQVVIAQNRLLGL